MKETVTISRTKFTCDNCSKVIEEQSKFPYDKGWRYLHGLDGRVGNSGFAFSKMDRHYCSIKCLSEDVMKVILKAEDNGNKAGSNVR